MPEETRACGVPQACNFALRSGSGIRPGPGLAATERPRWGVLHLNPRAAEIWRALSSSEVHAPRGATASFSVDESTPAMFHFNGTLNGETAPAPKVTAT